MHWLESRFNVSIIWNFFATSHGKGPVDAISGTVTVNSLVKCNTKIKSCNISSNNISSIVEKDLQTISSNASALNGIFTTHQIKNVNGHTEMRPYSQALYAINPLPNTETENVETENLIIVLVLQKKSLLVHLLLHNIYSLVLHQLTL